MTIRAKLLTTALMIAMYCGAAHADSTNDSTTSVTDFLSAPVITSTLTTADIQDVSGDKTFTGISSDLSILTIGDYGKLVVDGSASADFDGAVTLDGDTEVTGSFTIPEDDAKTNIATLTDLQNSQEAAKDYTDTTEKDTLYSAGDGLQLSESVFSVDPSVLRTTGIQTASGTTHFTGTITVPTPNNGSDAASKSYVDAAIENAADNNGDDSHPVVISSAYGTVPIAKGTSSIAAGDGAKASGDHSIAVGYGAKAAGYMASAYGDGATASGSSSIAHGNQAISSGFGSIAHGAFARASAFSSIAHGYQTTASGIDSIASGYGATASGNYSSAYGPYATTEGGSSIAHGFNAKASGDYSIASGYNAQASATKAIAIGYKSTATVADTVSVGNDTTKRKIVNVANGTSDNDVATYAQAISYSDRRLKENIATIAPQTGLDTVLSLNPVSFDWKKDGTASQGLIAQEVETIIPSAVHDEASGYKSLDYKQLISPMIAAIQALEKENSELKADNAVLKADNAALKNDNTAMKDRLIAVEARLEKLEME